MNNRVKAAVAFATLLVMHAVAMLPPPEGLTSKSMAMIGITIMAVVYWATECVPMPLTGVMIMLAQALYGVFPLAKAVSYIASDVNILVLAGLVISLALGVHGIDKYIGIKVLSIMGEKSSRLVLGLMLSTAILSMWIPNTAAAALMAPIAFGVLKLVNAERTGGNLGKAMMIGVAYAATIGGIGTPVGTPPVPITIRNIREATGVDIGFATWMSWGVPVSLLLVVVAWWLLMLFYRPEHEVIAGSREVVERELRSMGGLNRVQRKTLILFSLVALLWLLDPVFSRWVSGWTYVVSLLAIALFSFPVIGVLSWSDISEKADWGVLFLIAGGLALGAGLRDTGVVDVIARAVAAHTSGLPEYGVLLVISVVSGLSITVFSSITATSSTMVPVAIGVAKATGVDPVIAGVVAGIASCYAFLLPANTPPNAIAYSYGYFKNYEMARIGIVLILASSLLLLPFTVLIRLVAG